MASSEGTQHSYFRQKQYHIVKRVIVNLLIFLFQKILQEYKMF